MPGINGLGVVTGSLPPTVVVVVGSPSPAVVVPGAGVVDGSPPLPSPGRVTVSVGATTGAVETHTYQSGCSPVQDVPPRAGFQAWKSAEAMPAAAMMEPHVSARETSQSLVQSAARPDWVGSAEEGVVGSGAVRVVGVSGTAMLGGG